MKAILILLSLQSFAFSQDLKVGDILLQPLHCWACNLIEAQTKSEYSHIGIVVDLDDNGRAIVAEAYSKVRLVSFAKFNKKTQKNLSIEILRPYWVSPNLYTNFLKSFYNLPYDSEFLWGDEKIYCSELVEKLLSQSDMKTPGPVPMKFDVNREYWFKYFKGNIPDGLLGVTPVSFKESNLYESLGFYNDL